MKTFYKSISLIGIIALSLTSCEDVIDIRTRDGVQQLVVDAWITDELKPQVVKLTLSQNYFDNTPPPPVLGATVFMFSQDSTAYQFIDEKGNGEYTYQLKDGKSFLNKVGQQYALFILYEGEQYVSASQLKPVPKIDSISYEAFTRPIVTDTLPKKGFIAQFYAKDFEGKGDASWIRYKKNGKLKNKPNDITTAFDGSFSPGSDTDGLLFIQPIRQSINDFGEALYQDGDLLEVNLYAITPEAFYFLFQVRQESSNAGIFATPPANIPTNIVNRNSSSKKTAIGFFGVSTVSTFKTIIDKNKARPERN